MRQAKYLAMLVVGSSFIGASVQSDAAPLTSADLQTAAVRLSAEYDANYALHDPAKMASLYAEDGVLVSPGGNIIHGRKELLSYYTKRFSSGGLKHHIAVQEVHVQGDGGYGVAKFSIESKDPSGKINTESGNLVAVYVDGPDGWHFRLVEPSIPPKAAG